MSAPRISYEFFPPQSIQATFRLFETVNALAPTHPDFVSVTYGAGGTTRKLTHDAVETIHKQYGLNVAAHLTCVDATREETLAIADSYADAGVTEIVALRGDPPKGQGHFSAHPDGFANSVELVEALAKTGKFKIRVGAYPDPHPEAKDTQSDVDWLKRKIDAGATSAITQFFFEADTFFRFRDRCEKAGINAEIIPGILPIEHWKGTKNFAKRCGTPVPQWLDDKFNAAIADGSEAKLGSELAIDLSSKLVEGGAKSLHFYTLNKPALTSQVVGSLGVPTATSKPQVA